MEEEIHLTASAERRSSAWDIQNAPKNYFSLVLAQGGGALFAFASVWLLTRSLGSEGYGGIVAVIAASQVVQVLVNWTGTAVVRYGVDEFIETGRIARAFWLRLIILLVNFALVLSLSQFWFPPLADWLKLTTAVFWLLVLHFIVSALWVHLQFSFQAAKMPRQQAFLLTLERVLVFTGIVFLFFSGRLNLFTAVLCYAVIPVLMILAGLFLLRKFIFFRFSLDWRFFRKILVYSLPLLPFSLVGYFSGGYVDAVFVSKFLSTRDLGIYSVATQINGLMLQFPTLANILLLPLFVTLQKESQDQQAFNYFRNVLPVLTLFWGMACTVLAFAGCFAIPLIFGAEFQPAVSPLWILLLASAVSLPAFMGYFALSNSISATYISMYGVIFAAAANIAGNFLLIPAYGMAGCAWATVITYLVNVIVTLLLLRRKIKISVSWVFTAMLPALAGGLALSLTGNIWLSLGICAAMSFLIVYLYRDSVRQTLVFIKTFVRGKRNEY